MPRIRLSVPDISCEHCESTITKVLSGRPGVNSVRVEVSARSVHLDLDTDRLSLQQVKEILAEEEYPVDSVVEG